MPRKTAGPWFREAKNCWYATVDGKKVCLHVRGRENERDAYKAWHRLMAGEAVQTARKPPKAERKTEIPPTGSASLQAVADGFLTDCEDRLKPHTLTVYRWFLTLFADAFGKRAAESIKPFEVEAFARRATWGPTTRADFLGTVVSCFRWAARVGMISSNPLTGVRKPRRHSRGSRVVVSEAVHRKFVEAANPALADLLTVLWETGCRPSELFNLTAAMVDWTNGVVLLTHHKTADKTGKPRLIVLTATALAVLRRAADRNPDGPLLRKLCGQPWNADDLGRMLRVLGKRIGEKVIAYGYRHAFATDALSKGVPDATVAALLGHSGTAMLHRHYSHLTSRAAVLRDAARLVRG
jgi:integrase/recombinase XerC